MSAAPDAHPPPASCKRLEARSRWRGFFGEGHFFLFWSQAVAPFQAVVPFPRNRILPAAGTVLGVGIASTEMTADEAAELARINGEALLAAPPGVRAVVLDWCADAIDAAISIAMVAPYSSPLERSLAILQADMGATALNSAQARHTGCLDVIRQTTASLGFAANYRGLAWSMGSRCLLKPMHDRVAAHSEALAETMLPQYDARTEFWPWLRGSMLSGALSSAVSSPLRLAGSMPLTLVHVDLRPLGSGMRPTGLGHLGALLQDRGGLVYTASRIVLLSMLHIALYRGAYFFVRDFAVDLLRAQTCNAHIAKLLSRNFAKAAGVLAATCLTYPLDLIQTRLVLANSEPPSDTVERSRIGVRKCVASVVASEHGVLGLWRGLRARVLLLLLNVAARKIVQASY